MHDSRRTELGRHLPEVSALWMCVEIWQVCIHKGTMKQNCWVSPCMHLQAG